MDNEKTTGLSNTPSAESPAEARHYAYFQNTACEYFPCHAGADREDFNCLFCYCPLYALGEACGGNFRYLPNGIKDCSACLVPHRRDNYDAITGRFDAVAQLAKRKE